MRQRGVVARSIDAYLSPGYNPPADGLALDALVRVRANIDRALADDDLAGRREMMAGGLNSSLSLQKGLCVVHAIANAVASVTPVPVDPITLGGILIPELVRYYSRSDDGRMSAIRARLGLDEHDDLAHSLDDFMERLSLPRRLRDLRVDARDLSCAARLASRDRAILNGPRSMGPGEIEAILSAVH